MTITINITDDQYHLIEVLKRMLHAAEHGIEPEPVPEPAKEEKQKSKGHK